MKLGGWDKPSSFGWRSFTDKRATLEVLFHVSSRVHDARNDVYSQKV